MKSRRKPAFTLVELLIVIMTLALLVALLVPTISAVWSRSLMTQCQLNLRNLFKAHSLWRTEHETGQFATGPGWPTAILPYLEGRSTTLQCPGRTARTFEGDPPAKYLTLDDIVVKVYNSRPGGSRGTFRYEVPMTATGTEAFPIWKEMERGNNQKEYWFCDYGYEKIGGGDWDIGMLVTFTGGIPVYIVFTQPPGSGGHWWWFDIYVCGELVRELPSLASWAPDIDLRSYGSSPADYAVSIGFYEVTGGDVHYPDGKLFFILDYATSLADYREPVGGDDWTIYLAEEPPKIWNPPRALEGLSWDAVTALRHFRRANVLFGDGHVESLGLKPDTNDALYDGKYLRPDSPLWRYSGP